MSQKAFVELLTLWVRWKGNYEYSKMDWLCMVLLDKSEVVAVLVYQRKPSHRTSILWFKGILYVSHAV